MKVVKDRSGKPSELIFCTRINVRRESPISGTTIYLFQRSHNQFVMSEFVVEKSVTLNASPLMVWRALTNPEMTKKYFFHCRVHSDWKAGSLITFKGRALMVKNIELKGVIVKAEPGKLLKYILQNA